MRRKWPVRHSPRIRAQWRSRAGARLRSYTPNLFNRTTEQLHQAIDIRRLLRIVRQYIELENDLEEGKYYAEEIQAAPGYIRDTQERTFRVKRGETTEIVWENTAQYGQIQITKKSKDYNSINGLPAGTLLQGATFEIYDKAQNVVDTVLLPAGCRT